MSEKVSVIIPCYNGEKYISRSIQSVYEQDYDNIELVVVDDGSTDNSKHIIISWQDSFSQKGYELKYIYQNNKGLGGAINTGLKHITGEYLSILDADDEYLPHCISSRVEYLERNMDIAIVRTNGYIVQAGTKRLFMSDKEKTMDNVFLAMLRWETSNWAGSYMLRTKDLFEFYPDKNIYESRDGQNLQLMLPLLYNKKCGYIDSPHMNYNIQDASLSQERDSEKKERKLIRCAEGYTDIRIVMIKLIVKDRDEQHYYEVVSQDAKWRYFMNIALIYKDKSLMKEAKSALEKNDDYLIDDKIKYYTLFFPVFSYFLRIKRKTIKMLTGKNDG